MPLTAFEQAGIVRATDCPHYITAARARALAAAGTEKSRCLRCYYNPVQVFGMYDQSGPMRTRKYYSHAKCTHPATTRARERCRAEMAAAR